MKRLPRQLLPALAALLLGLAVLPLVAQTLPAPGSVHVENNADDLSGGSVLVKWTPVAKGGPAPAAYRVYVGEEPTKLATGAVVEGADQDGAAVNEMKVGERYKDVQVGDAHSKRLVAIYKDLKVGHAYYVQVGALYLPAGTTLLYDPDDANHIVTDGLVEAKSAVAGPATTAGRWYDTANNNVLVGTVLFSLITLVVLGLARKRDMYVRPIAGLQAVEDAIGRATEMGRPILYVTGLGGADDIATITSMLILGHLATKTAPYGTSLIVPCSDPMVMTAEREIVSQAYLHAGHPETYNAENIFFITGSQFGFVTAVGGIMLRQRPAVNFFMGYFAAESLILAETGNMVDSLQIAGTDQDTQLPFFIVSCDYTLMGEELYAAGAYLSRNPILLAQLKAQDLGKALLAALMIVGIILEAGAWSPQLAKWFLSLLKT
ncbi:MAG TPA: DUF6754 domain-containing protein [Armatimonadota bacterium]